MSLDDDLAGFLKEERRTPRCSPALQSFQPAHTSACNITHQNTSSKTGKLLRCDYIHTLEPQCLIRQQEEEVRSGQRELQISLAHPNPARHSSLQPLPHFCANVTPQKGMAKCKYGKSKFPDKTRKTTVCDISHFEKSHGGFLVGGDLIPIRLSTAFLLPRPNSSNCSIPTGVWHFGDLTASGFAEEPLWGEH